MAATNPDPREQKLDNWLKNFEVIKSRYSNIINEPFLDNLINEFVLPGEFKAKFSLTYDLCFLHLNIRSLNSKVVEFIQLIDELNVTFDFIVISEVWTTNLNFYNNILTGYNLIFDVPVDTHVGGVAIFYHSSLSVNNLPHLKVTTSASCKTENLWIKIRKNENDFCVGAVYRHPNGNVQEFCDKLEHTINNIPKNFTLL